MSKDFDKCQEELNDIKNIIKNLDKQISDINNKVDQIFEIISSLTILMYDEDDLDDDDSLENDDWTPYSDDNWEVNGEDDSYYPEDFSDN